MIKKTIQISAFLLVFALTISLFLCGYVYAEDEDSTSSQATINDNFTDNEVIIVLKPFANFTEYTTESFSSALVDCIGIEELSYVVNKDVLSRIVKLTIGGHSKQNVLNVIEILKQRDDVYSAEPNYISNNSLMSNLPVSISNTSNLNGQWWINNINLPNAWDNPADTNAHIKIGIVDTGIDATHDDLSEYINTDLSRCFTSAYNTGIEDSHGHGTMMAGIILTTLGAFDNNNEQHYSNVEIISLRVIDGSRNPDVAGTIQAITYAAVKGIDILNASFGFDTTEITSGQITSLQTAIGNYNGLLVCAAGNSLKCIHCYPIYPACLTNYSNVISVGASTSSNTRWVENSNIGSNYGSYTVDLFAPGVNIRTTSISVNNYTTDTGTSMSSPIVAGVAAIMLSVNPNLSPQELKFMLRSGVSTGFDDFQNTCITNGRLNAGNSVELAVNHRNHTQSLLNYDDNGHTVSCSICSFSSTIKHEFSLIHEDGENNEFEASCIVCGYTVQCSDWIESIEIDHYYHCTNCPSGCFMFFELHSYTISSTSSQHTYYCVDCGYSYSESHSYIRESNGNLYSHNVKCSKCNYISRTELHTWVSKMTYYVCSKCNQIESNVPVIMIVPPPENELYGSLNKNK